MNRRHFLVAMAATIVGWRDSALAQWPFARRARPSTANRDSSVQTLWSEISADLSHSAKRLSDTRLDEHYFEKRNAGAIGVGCFQRFHHAMTLAVGALWQRSPEGPQRLREAFSLLYWGAEILQHERIRKRIPYDVGSTFVLDCFWLHGLAAAGGASEIADWVGPYELNVFRATGGTGGTLELEADVPFQLFFRGLIETQVRGSWPSRIDRRAMRGYGGVMATVDDPKAFLAALVELCDYRVMQALGYDSMDARAPRPESRTGSVLDIGGWPKLFPLELFSLRYICQRTTGRVLSLDAEHPLLKTPLMNVPPLLPLHEDDFIRRARALAIDVFGSSWKPLTPAPLLAPTHTLQNKMRSNPSLNPTAASVPLAVPSSLRSSAAG